MDSMLRSVLKQKNHDETEIRKITIGSPYLLNSAVRVVSVGFAFKSRESTSN